MPTLQATGRRPPTSDTVTGRQLVVLALIFGLSLTHHGMTFMTAPALLLFLFLVNQRWWRRAWRTWLYASLAFGLPLLLYLYIPLRGGPAASPWYHQRLGDTTLDLYRNDWHSFLNFMTGHSIAVGFKIPVAALADLPQAFRLWQAHFQLPGLLLMAAGLLALIRQRNWPWLGFTAAYVLVQQLFNLFYNIGDISVYYIPLYLIGAIWAGFGVDQIWRALAHTLHPIQVGGRAFRFANGLFFAALFALPLFLLATSFTQLDQSGNRTARGMWESILAAHPAPDAILISNDRNEIVPLFYLQAVEDRAAGMTGLFPLIAPVPRFADIGATVTTALKAGNPQQADLIKPMPGLEIKFVLQEATLPIVRVLGPVTGTPTHHVDHQFGPLTLLGYDWVAGSSTVRIQLYWHINHPLDGDYTTTVQILDAAGQKLAQNDLPPGGVYYPTSLWKPGDRLVESHILNLPVQPANPSSTTNMPLPQEAATLSVGMYRMPNAVSLAPAIEIPLGR